MNTMNHKLYDENNWQREKSNDFCVKNAVEIGEKKTKPNVRR